MLDNQQGDVLLFQTPDDGDINVAGGIVEMSGGLETAVYLSLFGGNELDDGLDSSNLGWWGNIEEVDNSSVYSSETQFLLQSLLATAANLRRVEDAARRDLDWLLANNIASEVDVLASISDVDFVDLFIKINALGQEITFNFVENWKAA